MRGPSMPWLVGAASIALVSCALRVAPTPTQPTAPDALVDVGGHRLHVQCVGPADAGPTVILEAGGGGSASGWSAVQELLSSRVRVCAYDRAGLGTSEPGPAPRTMGQEVFELHALVAAAKLHGPFVLVGQSIGGLLVRLYTQRYDGDVAGMVLVDPTHESSVLYSLAAGRWMRLRDQATGRAVPAPRREGRVSRQYDPRDDYQAEEFQQLYLARQATPVPLGDRPLIVLGAGKRSPPPGTSDSLWQVLRQERDAQVRELAGLSRNSRFVLDPTSGHEMQVDDPRLVARSIEDVLDAAARRARLTP